MIKDEREFKRIGKFISLILRHEPQKIGVEKLDLGGYVFVTQLLDGLKKFNINITKADLDQLVTENNKQRYSYDESGARIRANQGHSCEVDLQLVPLNPPAILYHGTTYDAVPMILEEGIKKMYRHAVHLSENIETAINVGSRRGKYALLKVDSKQMDLNRFVFYRSENGVWLTEYVPPAYIEEVND